MDRKITLKEKIVEICQQSGYDFISSCEMATDTIKRFKESGEKKKTFYIGKMSFTLKKN